MRAPRTAALLRRAVAPGQGGGWGDLPDSYDEEEINESQQESRQGVTIEWWPQYGSWIAYVGEEKPDLPPPYELAVQTLEQYLSAHKPSTNYMMWSIVPPELLRLVEEQRSFHGPFTSFMANENLSAYDIEAIRTAIKQTAGREYMVQMLYSDNINDLAALLRAFQQWIANRHDGQAVLILASVAGRQLFRFFGRSAIKIGKDHHGYDMYMTIMEGGLAISPLKWHPRSAAFARTAALLRQAIRSMVEEERLVIEYNKEKQAWTIRLKDRQGPGMPYMRWNKVSQDTHGYLLQYLAHNIDRSLLEESPVYNIDFVYAPNDLFALSMLLYGFSKWTQEQHPESLVLIRANVVSRSDVRRYFDRRGLRLPRGDYILGMKNGRVLPLEAWSRPPEPRRPATPAFLRQAIRATTEEEQPVVEETDYGRYMLYLKGLPPELNKHGYSVPVIMWERYRPYEKEFKIDLGAEEAEAVYHINVVRSSNNISALSMLLQGFREWVKEQHGDSLVLVCAYPGHKQTLLYLQKRGLYLDNGEYVIGMKNGRVLPLEAWYDIDREEAVM